MNLILRNRRGRRVVIHSSLGKDVFLKPLLWNVQSEPWSQINKGKVENLTFTFGFVVPG